MNIRFNRVAALPGKLWRRIKSGGGDQIHQTPAHIVTTGAAVSPVELVARRIHPGVSIVSCCMNRNDNLVAALKSWVSLPVNEIIIVDWSSATPVSESIRHIQDARIRVIRVEGEPKWVLTHAFNVGLRAARFEKIYKLDADIIVSPDFLTLNAIGRGTYVRGNWRSAIESNRPDQKYVNGSFGAYKEDLERIGYYNEFIRTYGWDDSDLYYRLWHDLGLNHVYLDPRTIHHANQKEDERLANQKVASGAFLGHFPATEYHNMVNRHIASLHKDWRGNYGHQYRVLSSDGIATRIQRITPDSEIPERILRDARHYALILLAGALDKQLHDLLETNAVVADLVTEDYLASVPFDETSALIGHRNTRFTLAILHADEIDLVKKFTQEACAHFTSPVLLVVNSQSHFNRRVRLSGQVILRYMDDDGYLAVKAIHDQKLTPIDADSFIRQPTPPQYALVSTPSRPRDSRSILIVSLYDERNPARVEEYLSCLTGNLALFDEVVVFYEASHGDWYERLARLAHANNTPPLSIVTIRHRPRFGELFDYADTRYKGHLVCIANADILFDDSIRTLPEFELGDKFLVLSRTEGRPSATGHIHNLIHDQDGYPNFFSADAWIYMAPRKHTFPAHFHIGSFNCDTFLNYYISRSGYQIFNPCLDIAIAHLHADEGTSSHSKKVAFSRQIQQTIEYEMRLNGEFTPRGVLWSHLADMSVNVPDGDVVMWSEKQIHLRLDKNGTHIWHVLLLAIMAVALVRKRGGQVWLFWHDGLAGSPLHRAITGLRKFLAVPELIVAPYFDHFVDTPSNDALIKQRIDDTRLTAAFASLNGGTAGSQVDQTGMPEEFDAFWEGDKRTRHILHVDCDGMDDYRYLLACSTLTNAYRAIFEKYLGLLRQQMPVPETAYLPASPDILANTPANTPPLTFITSVFNGAEFIEQFLGNIAACAVLCNGRCILVDANSTDHSHALFQNYMESHPELAPRFEYLRLDHDPGLYRCWQIAIEHADTPFVSNANLDDRRSPLHALTLLQSLLSMDGPAAVASAIRATTSRNTAWYAFSEDAFWFCDHAVEDVGFGDLFVKDTASGLVKSRNMMHCMPIWRKDLHARHGYWNEARYGTSADWAFWLHCAKAGEKMKLFPQPLAMYYVNPGSHNRVNDTSGEKEVNIIRDYLGVEQRVIIKQ